MKPSIHSKAPYRFTHFLMRWSLIVPACAAPAFVIAFLFGYSSSREIAGMLTAIASFTIILAATGYCFLNHPEKENYRAAFYWAAVLKPVSLLLAGVLSFGKALPLFLWPDLTAGILSVSIMEGICSSGLPRSDDFAAADSFLQTCFTTLICGAMLLLPILLLLPGLAFLHRFLLQPISTVQLVPAEIPTPDGISR